MQLAHLLPPPPWEGPPIAKLLTRYYGAEEAERFAQIVRQNLTRVRTIVTRFARETTVDIIDESLGEQIFLEGKRKGIDETTLRLFIDYTNKTSFQFKGDRVEGEIGYSLFSPDTNHFYKAIRPPPDLVITQVHPHSLDTLTSLHVHLNGRPEFLSFVWFVVDTLNSVRELARVPR